MTNKGIVIKGVGGVFIVYSDGKQCRCTAPKKIRYQGGDILVGDKVSFNLKSKEIESVLPRKNQLKRPIVANVDLAFIFIASVPKPDLLLVDKVILNCIIENIAPILVVNKTDIAEIEFLNDIKRQYENICEIVEISALNNVGTERLVELIEGNTVCLAGQSAVGKSSFVNAIAPELDRSVGDLSEKTQRGKHTTRHSQIFPIGGGFLVDTTGFSLLNLSEIKSYDLCLYYPDMLDLPEKCKFNMCTHTDEPDCAVKNAVKDGTYPKERYLRYIELFNELKEAEKNQY